VVKYSPESNQFPTAYIQPHIFQKERAFARKVLGLEMYELLTADLVNHGTIKPYDGATTYALNDVVEYFGMTLKSLQGSNNINPCEDAEGDYWQEALKFTTPCYQTLWELYLRRFLAFHIMGEALEYTTYPAGAKGVIERVDQNTGTRTASFSIFTAHKQALLKDAGEVLENMVQYMQEQNKAFAADENTGCDFSKALFVNCETLPAAQAFSRPAKRFAFRSKW